MLRSTIRARCTASHTAKGVEGRLGARDVAGQCRGGQLVTPRDALLSDRFVLKGWVPGQTNECRGGATKGQTRESLGCGVKKRLRSRESSVFLPECWSSNLRDGLHVGEMKSAWFPSCAEAHDQPNLKLGGGEKRVSFRAVRLLPSPRRARGVQVNEHCNCCDHRNRTAFATVTKCASSAASPCPDVASSRGARRPTLTLCLPSACSRSTDKTERCSSG